MESASTLVCKTRKPKCCRQRASPCPRTKAQGATCNPRPHPQADGREHDEDGAQARTGDGPEPSGGGRKEITRLPTSGRKSTRSRQAHRVGPRYASPTAKTRTSQVRAQAPAKKGMMGKSAPSSLPASMVRAVCAVNTNTKNFFCEKLFWFDVDGTANHARRGTSQGKRDHAITCDATIRQ